MTNPDDDWSELARAWIGTTDDEPRLNPGLLRGLRRRDRLARINFAAELAGGVAVLGAVGWAVLGRDLPWQPAVAAIGFVAFALVMTLWSRRGDPGLLTETPEAVLRSAIGQARTGRRWAHAGVAISIAALVFLAVMVGMIQPDRGPQPTVLLASGLFLLACIGLYLRHAGRCRRRMAAYQAALEALSEPDGLRNNTRAAP